MRRPFGTRLIRSARTESGRTRLCRVLGLAVLCCAGVAAACSAGDEPESQAGAADERPNLILISMDTMRADRLSFYGERDRKTTPVLDKLAAEAAVFRDCIATSTVTGPSHLSMFTGQFAHRHGLVKNGGKVAPKYTLASALLDAGWNTAGFTGGGYLRELFGLNFGFETYRAKGGPLAQFKRTFETSIPHALDWLKSRPKGPFFLFLHGYDPHCPYEATPEGLREFGATASGPFDPAGLCGEEHYLPQLLSGEFDENDSRYLNDLYDALVFSADQSLKPFIYYLRKTGLIDESIIVFTSDHGESLGEHDWIGHGRLWEEQARVPLFIRFPEGRWAGDIDAPVSLVDLMPTLLDALEVPIPGGVQGRSLLLTLSAERDAFEDFGSRMRVVRFDEDEVIRFGSRWKIGFRRVAGEQMEQQLYDLQADPNELTNLIGTSAGGDLFEVLNDRYGAWRAETESDDAEYRILRGRPELDAEEEAELSGLGYGSGETDSE